MNQGPQLSLNFGPQVAKQYNEFDVSDNVTKSYGIVNPAAQLYPPDPCVKYNFCGCEITTLELICMVNKGFENACIPGCVLVTCAPVYDLCPPTCNPCHQPPEDPVKVGEAYIFVEPSVTLSDENNIVATAWILLVFCDGQLLFKSRGYDDNSATFEIRQRISPYEGCNGLPVTHVGSDSQDLIGATHCYCHWDGCAEVSGPSTIVTDDSDCRQLHMKVTKSYKSKVSDEEPTTLSIDWCMKVNFVSKDE
ncbi:MAG: hypothetical protein GY751_13815 [Bacteroidetes bacterium]|nr:hypothetical protein [Bacteroidota bacterium]